MTTGITVIGGGTLTEKGTATATITVPLNGSAAVGDMSVGLYGGNSASLIGTQTGYTTLIDHFSTGDTVVPDAWISRRTLNATDISNGTSTWSAVPSPAGSGQVLILRGASTTQDFTAVFLDKTSTANGNFTFPAQTTTMPRVIVIYVVCQNTGTVNFAGASGFTVFGDRNSGRTVQMAYRIFGNPGSTGSMTVTSANTGRGVGLMIGLRPNVQQGWGTPVS